jgi:HEAT repeats
MEVGKSVRFPAPFNFGDYNALTRQWADLSFFRGDSDLFGYLVRREESSFQQGLGAIDWSLRTPSGFLIMARACLCGILLGTMYLLQAVSGQTTKHHSERTSEIVEQFKTTTTFWKQFEVAKRVVTLHDKNVLQELEPWLSNEDMHLRGNAAFIFASLGDDRGFQVIKAILENRSPKRAVFTTDDAGHLNPQLQIRQDRYYAAHLFGDLKDVRAVPILVPLLRDEEVKEVVPWSLGQIGDKSAIPPLKEALSDNSLTMRASALRALEKLEAKEKSP